MVTAVSPWYLPLYLLTWKIAPALAAGNTVVAKPSEVTPWTATLLAELSGEIGLPAGVLNVVHGRGPETGEPLVTHADVRAVTFTGSTAVGRRIAGLAAPLLKKVSLELGGKNATLVFADGPWREHLDLLVRSAFQNTGQICLCGSRLLIQTSIYETFRDAFVERVRQLKVGDPLDPSTEFGAVVSKLQFDKVSSYLKVATEEGGRVLAGGAPLAMGGRLKDGWFIAPTVIEGLGPACRCNVEEIFGPVVTLQSFEDFDDAVALANAVPYGLAASVWTRDIDTAHRAAARIEAGIVWINCWMLRDLRTPFGGVKQSGVGREGGFEAMRFFTEPRNVCLSY